MFPDLSPRHAPPRLLLVVAHPDDESFGCGSLLLHAAALGWETTVVCATRGEAGEPARGSDLGDRPLGAHREEELHEAADVLGVHRLVLLDFVDSGMDGPAGPETWYGAEPEIVHAAVRAIAIETEPDVVVSLDGGDGHRDHARARDAAVQAATELGVPAYLHALPRSLMRRWAEHMARVRPEMAHLQYAELGTADEQVAVVIDTSAHLDARERAIAVHRTQTSPFEGLPSELRRDFLTRDHLVQAGAPT